MSMKNQVQETLRNSVKAAGIDAINFDLEYPENPEHGDFSTNIAMANAKKQGMSPRALAEKIVAEIEKQIASKSDSIIQSVTIAGPGFINFKIKDQVIAREAMNVSSREKYGHSPDSKGQEVMIEYTDPNTFKVFHIGHLMSNAIGESISRLIESSGSKVIRLCYPSDIGLHIAKLIWALQKHSAEMPADDAPIADRTTFLGKMYVEGTRAYETDAAVKDDIDALNKVIYEKSSPTINSLYEKGRKWSLDHFNQLYSVLDTKFDGFIYESEMAPVGLQIVRENIKPKGAQVFEESEGAVVFKGEDHGLHTRVFISSQGLPTYEAKEIGLNITKFKQHPDAAQSIIVTASEQNDYFKVLTKVISLIDPKDGPKMKHIGHGMMRFASGKMSSRTGNVVTAESLMAEMKDMVKAKMAERELSADEIESIADAVSVAAIKYTILRSSVGSDIIFDSAASISFEGDSGPYLQYSAVRAGAVIAKAKKPGSQGAKELGSKGEVEKGGAPDVTLPEKVGQLERLITRFPDIVERARMEFAPQYVATYLIDLAGAFNSFYNAQQIVDEKDPLSPYYVELTKAFRTTMVNGLWLLGIKVPERM